MDHLYHLTPPSHWEASGEHYRPASLDLEGFIHLSGSAAQAIEVANRFYRDEPELILLEVSTATIRDQVRWEAPAHPDGSQPTEDDPLFPHLYGPLPRGAVRGHTRLQRGALGDWTLATG